MKFWYTEPDPRIHTSGSECGYSDPAIFVSDLQDVIKKFFVLVFLLFTFDGTFTSFFKDKKWQKEVTKE
jgi:hypothetical protein